MVEKVLRGAWRFPALHSSWAQKQVLEALGAFLLGILTPQQPTKAQAAFAEPPRQLIKEHGAILAASRDPTEENSIECEARNSTKAGADAARAWLQEKATLKVAFAKLLLVVLRPCTRRAMAVSWACVIRHRLGHLAKSSQELLSRTHGASAKQGP